MPLAPLVLLTAAVAETPAEVFPPPVPPGGVVIFEDAFDRAERDDAKEQVGGGWSTNSRARANGHKQADLEAGALRITTHPTADHGASLRHAAAFTDGLVTLRFKLGKGDSLGVDVADGNDNTVHAGHLMLARVTPKKLSVQDSKTGGMRKDLRDARKAGTLTAAQKKLIRSKRAEAAVDLAPGVWHTLVVRIVGDTLTAAVDGGDPVSLTSAGIAHPTKRMIRLAVPKSAWVDDVRVVRLPPAAK